MCGPVDERRERAPFADGRQDARRGGAYERALFVERADDGRSGGRPNLNQRTSGCAAHLLVVVAERGDERPDSLRTAD
jgi:hypothetical protein